MSRRYFENKGLTEEYLDIKKWPTVLWDCIDKKYVDTFISRREAVINYMTTDMPIDDITNQFKVSKSELYRLIDRCFEIANTK